MPSQFLFRRLQNLRASLYKHFAGRGIGKKLPGLWKLYDKSVRLLAPKQFTHEVNGQTLLIDLDEPNYQFRRILEDYAYLSDYEPNTVAQLKKVIKKGDVVLDVGASIGPLSLVMSELVGDEGKVYAIEPTPVLFYYLCENIRLNKRQNIVPYQVAAWEKDELVKVQPGLKRGFWANGVALDDWLERMGISKIDFIKMDIDGPEPVALRGLRRTIAKNPQLKMIIEYYPKYIRDFGGSPEEVLNILDTYFTYSPVEGDYGDGYWNYYCVRKSVSTSKAA